MIMTLVPGMTSARQDQVGCPSAKDSSIRVVYLGRVRLRLVPCVTATVPATIRLTQMLPVMMAIYVRITIHVSKTKHALALLILAKILVFARPQRVRLVWVMATVYIIQTLMQRTVMRQGIAKLWLGRSVWRTAAARIRLQLEGPATTPTCVPTVMPAMQTSSVQGPYINAKIA